MLTRREFEYKYRIDAHDRITFVNDAWVGFAADNGAPELTRESVVGQSLWCYVAGQSLIPLYELLFEQIRRHQVQSISIPFRCDADEVRRYMELRLCPLGGRGIEITGRLLLSQPRPTVRILAPGHLRSQQVLMSCSACKRMLLDDGRWEDAENVMEAFELGRAAQVPLLEHELCPDCIARFHGLLHGRRSEVPW